MSMISTRSSLGSTELSCPDKCEQLYDYEYWRNLIPIATKPGRHRGSLLHLCMKYWYAQLMPEEIRPEWFWERTLEETLVIAGRGEPKLIDEVHNVIFPRYVMRYGEMDKAWKILALEKEYTIGLELLLPAIQALIERRLIPVDEAQALWTSGVRPSIQLDLVGELVHYYNEQDVMDFKSTVGQWGKLPKWHEGANAFYEGGEYAMAWQPHEYWWIAQRITNEDGSPVFPRLSRFLVQRIQTIAPWAMDRPTLPIRAHLCKDVPETIVMQLIKRQRLRERLARGDKMQKNLWHCYGRGGLCDFGPVCWSSNPEHVLATSYRKRDDVDG